FSACWLRPSIKPCCVVSSSGAFEYCSSTGRVRNRQPALGSTARTRVKAQKGELRLMQSTKHLQPFEYTAKKRMQKSAARHPCPESGGYWRYGACARLWRTQVVNLRSQPKPSDRCETPYHLNEQYPSCENFFGSSWLRFWRPPAGSRALSSARPPLPVIPSCC